jgi:heme-degrading monooxygenase HmoA
MTATSVEAWFRSAEHRPADGEVVLAYYEASADLGPEMWIVLEHHHRKAKLELNSHVWHAPGNDEDDYSIPTHWRSLDRPLTDEEQTHG